MTIIPIFNYINYDDIANISTGNKASDNINKHINSSNDNKGKSYHNKSRNTKLQ